MSAAVDAIVSAIEGITPDEVISLVDALCPCLPVKLPLEALVKLGFAIEQEITAKTRLQEMQAAVKAIDAQVDAAEQEAVKAGQWP